MEGSGNAGAGWKRPFTKHYRPQEPSDRKSWNRRNPSRWENTWANAHLRAEAGISQEGPRKNVLGRWKCSVILKGI